MEKGKMLKTIIEQDKQYSYAEQSHKQSQIEGE